MIKQLSAVSSLLEKQLANPKFDEASKNRLRKRVRELKKLDRKINLGRLAPGEMYTYVARLSETLIEMEEESDDSAD